MKNKNTLLDEIYTNALILNSMVEDDEDVRDVIAIMDAVRYLKRSDAFKSDDAFNKLNAIDKIINKLTNCVLDECINEIADIGGYNAHKFTKPIRTAQLQREVNND